jgi:hypothetical protein
MKLSTMQLEFYIVVPPSVAEEHQFIITIFTSPIPNSHVRDVEIQVSTKLVNIKFNLTKCT